ncbi:hypothetical protein HDU76_010334, partial [Blyttiomyces sp. JEL0837]
IAKLNIIISFNKIQGNQAQQRFQPSVTANTFINNSTGNNHPRASPYPGTPSPLIPSTIVPGSAPFDIASTSSAFEVPGPLNGTLLNGSQPPVGPYLTSLQPQSNINSTMMPLPHHPTLIVNHIGAPVTSGSSTSSIVKSSSNSQVPQPTASRKKSTRATPSAKKDTSAKKKVGKKNKKNSTPAELNTSPDLSTTKVNTTSNLNNIQVNPNVPQTNVVVINTTTSNSPSIAPLLPTGGHHIIPPTETIPCTIEELVALKNAQDPHPTTELTPVPSASKSTKNINPRSTSIPPNVQHVPFNTPNNGVDAVNTIPSDSRTILEMPPKATSAEIPPPDDIELFIEDLVANMNSQLASQSQLQINSVAQFTSELGVLTSTSISQKPSDTTFSNVFQHPLEPSATVPKVPPIQQPSPPLPTTILSASDFTRSPELNETLTKNTTTSTDVANVDSLFDPMSTISEELMDILWENPLSKLVDDSSLPKDSDNIEQQHQPTTSMFESLHPFGRLTGGYSSSVQQRHFLQSLGPSPNV